MNITRHNGTISDEDFQKAFTMYSQLQKNGKITKDYPLFTEYARPVIQMMIDEFAQIADAIVFETAGTIYMTPGSDNGFLGLSNEEARKLFKAKDSRELYLCYFTLIVLLANFYNSDYQSDAGRTFLLVSQLAEFVSAYMADIQKLSDEELDTKISEDGIQYREIAKYWFDKMNFDPTITELKRGSNNHISFLLKQPLAALEKEELIAVTDDQSIIRLLPKIKHLIEGSYFDMRRKEKLLHMLSRPLEDENASH
ncbi:DUF6063 family protein [Paenibacillus albus]|uniref:Non-ribosomal peptide synthetase module n=1 Tax=Paenibacillus albus TaxID=2495582 RepID=A0A3S9A3V3_9BACL|nr:DUF6063 family protein [Paenibacillus albus]AZN40408.1 hypothetical protein EJC50_12670 [Paenibacillus albus]